MSRMNISGFPFLFHFLNPYGRKTMSYHHDAQLFRDHFNQQYVDNSITPDCHAIHYNFCSNADDQLIQQMNLSQRDNSFKALLKYFLKQNQYSDKYIFQMLELPDSEITENKKFKYTVLTPNKTEKAQDVIFLFHGLNEKNWQKYLPWAKRLMDLTGKSIILFPMAFHMDRAPKEWSNPRLMHYVKKERRQLFPDSDTISYANTAISHRLQFAPERMLLSGMQTYYDVLALVQQIKNGTHPDIAQHASIDIFAYSIGVMLAEVLLMADPNGWFQDSKMFLFAGGSVLNRMTPANKSILDDEASQAVQHYYSNFNTPQAKNKNNWLGQDRPEIFYFKSLLHFDHLQEERETRLQQIGKRITGISLAQDRVVSPMGILPTIEGRTMETNCHVEVVDFDYPCSHENPFPLKEEWQPQVEKAFHETFQAASYHLS